MVNKMVKHRGITILLSRCNHICGQRSGYRCGQLVRHEKDGKFYYAADDKLEITGNCQKDARTETIQKDIKLGIHSCYEHEEENTNILMNIFIEKLEVK